MPRSSTRTSDLPVMSNDPRQQASPDGDTPTPPVADPDPPPGPDPAGPAAPEEGAAGQGGTTPEGIPTDEATEVPADADDFTPEQIDALVAERDQFLDAYQRTAADFDNFRKLSQKRLADEVTRTQGSFVERLLPVLDAIDAARIQGGDQDAGSVETLAKALFGFLEKEGLERVHPADEPFDPNVAEAVVHEPGDAGTPDDEPIVSEVLRTGYLWQGRVIRPAMVKVSG